MQRYAPLRRVIALWLAGLCAAAQFAKVGLVLPELGMEYPEATTGLGFVVSSISVVGIVLGLTAGVLATRFGPRRLLLYGLALGAIVSLAQAFLPSLPILLASRVLEGVSHLAIIVTAPTLIAAVSSDRWRGAAMTFWGTFFGVSFALVAYMGLPLVDEHGLQALFVAHGLCMAIVALLLLQLLPRDSSHPGESRKRKSGEVFRTHVRAWTSPFIAAPAAGWLFYTLTFVALIAVLPSQVPQDQRAFVAAAMPLASIIASMTLGVYLLRRISAVRVIMLGFLLASGLALLLPAFAGQAWPCIALCAALGLIQGASFAAIPELNESSADQALANGTIAQSGNLGNAIGTPLLLMVLASQGLQTLVALLIGCYVAGIVLHRVLEKLRQARLVADH